MATYALLASSRASGEYLHLTARMVALADDGAPRNLPTDDAYRVDGMAGVVATAQADRSDHGTQPSAPEYSYAWRVGMTADAGTRTVSPAIPGSVMSPGWRRRK